MTELKERALCGRESGKVRLLDGKMLETGQIEGLDAVRLSTVQ
jgi:hypothetical protein